MARLPRRLGKQVHTRTPVCAWVWRLPARAVLIWGGTPAGARGRAVASAAGTAGGGAAISRRADWRGPASAALCREGQQRRRPPCCRRRLAGSAGQPEARRDQHTVMWEWGTAQGFTAARARLRPVRLQAGGDGSCWKRRSAGAAANRTGAGEGAAGTAGRGGHPPLPDHAQAPKRAGTARPVVAARAVQGGAPGKGAGLRDPSEKEGRPHSSVGAGRALLLGGSRNARGAGRGRGCPSGSAPLAKAACGDSKDAHTRVRPPGRGPRRRAVASGASMPRPGACTCTWAL